MIKHFKIKEDKIEVIYHKPIFDNNYSEGREFENYFLYVGNRKKHKNLTTAIKVLDKIFNLYPEYKFYIVGKKFEKVDYIDKEISKCKNKNNFVQFTNVDDAELYNFYKKAYIFLFLSEYEGFGIPPLEAFSFGVPCIASNNSSIKEVVQEGGILVDESNEKDIYNNILKIMKDSNLYNRLVEGTKKNF